MVHSIGKTLKEERLRQGISLQEVSMRTLIRKNHLIAIEDDDFSLFASEVQTKGFIRIYSEFLRIDPIQYHVEGESSETKIDLNQTIESSLNPVINNELTVSPQTPSEESVAQLDESPNEGITESEIIPEIIIAKDKPKSQQIFEELGDQLRKRRDMLNFSLSSVEDYTHVKKENLEALEDGDHSSLPSPVQTRGMLINYSRFLNLDESDILLKFAEALQERRLENSRQKPHKIKTIKPATSTSLSIRKFFTLDLLFGSILIIGILSFLIWGASNMFTSGQNDTIDPTIPNIAEVLISTELFSTDLTQTPEPSESVMEATDTFSTTILVLTPLVSNSPIQITIIARQSTWIRVISDEKIILEGRIEAGNALTYNANSKLELISGNASALQVFFKEEDLGTLGLLGQVVTLIFDKNGLVRPTITPSPTSTNTPQLLTTPTPDIIN